MNILLAGHKGFVGNRLKEMLGAAGHDVWLFNRGDSLKWGPVCHADAVINAAGETHNKDKMIDDNLIFAAQLAETCNIFNKRLIHIGSVAERLECNLYGATKKSSTELILALARMEKAKFTVVSPATVFGPGDRKDSFMNRIWNAYEKNTSVELKAGRRDWVYIDDLCQAILMVLIADPDKTNGHVFEVGYGWSISTLTILETFSTIVGRVIKPKVSEIIYYQWYADNCGIQQLGWEPQTDIIQGIRKFIDFKMTDGRVWLGAEA